MNGVAENTLTDQRHILSSEAVSEILSRNVVNQQLHMRIEENECRHAE